MARASTKSASSTASGADVALFLLALNSLLAIGFAAGSSTYSVLESSTLVNSLGYIIALFAFFLIQALFGWFLYSTLGGLTECGVSGWTFRFLRAAPLALSFVILVGASGSAYAHAELLKSDVAEGTAEAMKDVFMGFGMTVVAASSATFVVALAIWGSLADWRSTCSCPVS